MQNVKPRSFEFKLFLHLIRAIFPRWDFFEQVAYSFELSLKTPDSAGWEKLSFHQPRQLFTLFFNPGCNSKLAQYNVIEHFVQDLAELQKKTSTLQQELLSTDVQALTSFKMLFVLIANRLPPPELAHYCIQFKITACSPNEITDIYYSDWLPLPKGPAI